VPRRVRERLQPLVDQTVQGVRFALHDASSEAPLPASDLVVHKAVNDVVLRSGDAAAAARYATLQQLAARVPLLDPLESMAVFADRGELCRMLDALRPGVRQPRFLELREPAESVLDAARAAGLRFPLLCKPLVACGPPASHELAVVLGEEGLRRVAAPVLLQEYVAHGSGVMLKGYCVGRRVHVVRRPSLPDLRHSGQDGTALVRFDSQQPPPDMAAFGAAAPAGPPPEDALADAEWDRRRACVERIAHAVAEHLAVQLLGVDVVFAEPAGEPHVVDVNYFPHGPESFPGFALALAELARQRVESRRAG
jgi:inositol-1,3,4-trisphosphate 5/6-kinase/inositol-tetrakisphosphate 1-kinase